MYWWQVILFPFAILWDFFASIRNGAFDRNIRKSLEFDANVIVVGNLAIGGTGKTPMIEYLITHYLSEGKKVATLSRGYGRKTYGFRLAGIDDNAESIGDEPYMYYRKYGKEVPVAVCSERDLAIPELLGAHPDLFTVLLDDAYQHRKVKPSVNILLSTYNELFYKDYLLPAGKLRESRKGASRAEIIIVTKCPEFLSVVDQEQIKIHISKYSRAEVFFTTIIYESIQPFGNGDEVIGKVVGISGLAKHRSFEKYLKSTYQVKLTHAYRDHFRYEQEDIRDIINELKDGSSLITTEKDMVKLSEFEELKQYPCFFVPIRIKFLGNESLFHSILESYLKNDAQEMN